MSGGSAGYDIRLDAIQLFEKEITFKGSNSASIQDLRQVVSYFESGELSPSVDQVLQLDEAGEAHRLLGDRSRCGKIVLLTD